jgi:catechol 2,3-dioxygenase-like lactoylglutathione lyase family enzyme
MTNQLHSVAIFVTDLERARAFYEDGLGLPLAAKGSFGFQFGEQPPFLGVHPAAHDGAKAMVGRETGLTIRVEDLVGLRADLGMRGISLLTEPVQQGFGRMAMVADPDGNVLALWEDNTTEDDD